MLRLNLLYMDPGGLATFCIAGAASLSGTPFLKSTRPIVCAVWRASNREILITILLEMGRTSVKFILAVADHLIPVDRCGAKLS